MHPLVKGRWEGNPFLLPKRQNVNVKGMQKRTKGKKKESDCLHWTNIS